jgi:purine nucleoside permease
MKPPCNTSIQRRGQTAGGFGETVENIELVGSRVVDHIVADWPQWAEGAALLPAK